MSRWSRSSGPVRVLTGITAGLAVMGGTACFVAPAPPTSRQATAAEVRQRFPLLQEGRTSAREIRARFGEPASEHDAGRMLIYLLWFDDLQCLQLQRDNSGSMLAGRPDASPKPTTNEWRSSPNLGIFSSSRLVCRSDFDDSPAGIVTIVTAIPPALSAFASLPA